MSLAGFKKQINKANQYVSEKIGGAKGTELDDEFVEMEKKTDAMGHLVEELMIRTHELLQPNPASRAKMLAVKSISKLRGQTNHTLYPQPEGQLGECMTKYGKELGEDSLYGQSLVEAGESYRQLAEVKYGMEDNVKQNFIEPLLHLQNKDLKEVNFHRKKLHGRRLDYDCKKRKQLEKAAGCMDEELRAAEEKFDESKQLAEIAMQNLLDNDSEQVMQLAAFIEAEVQFHQQSVDILQALMDSLRKKCQEAANRPRREHVPKKVTSFTRSDRSESPAIDNHLDGKAAQVGSGAKQPCAEALYDFEAENEGELGFKEGDMIQLINRIDENWLEGSVHGKTGYFPYNYVNIIVDLPSE